MNIIGTLGVLLTGDPTSLVSAASRAKEAITGVAAQAQTFDSQLAHVQGSVNSLFRGAMTLGVVGAVKAWEPLERKLAGLGAIIGDSGVVEEIAAVAQKMSDFANIDELRMYRSAESLKMMGVKNKELANMVMLVQGMSMASNGMIPERMAMRMVTAYQQGSTTMFDRWIPALKKARTEEEKAGLIQEWIQKGYAKTAAEMNTSAGQMQRVSAAAQDIKEEFGKLFVETLQLDRVFGLIGAGLRAVREWFVNLSPGVRGWVSIMLLAAAAVAPLTLAIRVLIPLLVGLGKTILTSVLPYVAMVAMAFMGWNLGRTLDQVKVGSSTIGQYMKSLTMTIYEGWTWLWDVMPLKVARSVELIRAKLSTLRGGDGFEHYRAANSIQEQVDEVEKRRGVAEKLNSEWLKKQQEESNKTAITSFSDFAQRFGENSGKALETIVDKWGSFFSEGGMAKWLPKNDVKAPEFKLPSFGADKIEKSQPNYTAALERGTAAAYSAQLKQAAMLSSIDESSAETAENTAGMQSMLTDIMGMMPEAAGL